MTFWLITLALLVAFGFAARRYDRRHGRGRIEGPRDRPASELQHHHQANLLQRGDTNGPSIGSGY